MGRYKTRSDVRNESIALKYVRMRGAMVDIRVALGLGERVKLEEIVEAVKELVAKNGEKESK